ncbi:hypothetical protein HP456_08210 [Bacillus haikouensis]|jgi:hypothetical protein|uniref:hypothetical protein n=1 Tax=Bacillus haikouensis TaxID=1510468 RepID=UPI0015567E16|nr:hypothetical protein [Bacillus haikouensis]NQD65905.1 hypothetical protein [Bacillus haikouensis]
MRKIVMKVSSVDKLRFQNYMMQLKRAESKAEADTYYRLAKKILEKGRKQA